MKVPRSFRLGAWPATDQALWDAATSILVGVLDQGDCAHWKPATKRQALYAYGCWLAFLMQTDPYLLSQSPSVRLTDERLKIFTDALATRVSAQSVASAIGHLINAIHAVVPGYDTRWLRQRQYYFHRLRSPKDKRARMVPAGKLYALGLKLMDQAVTMPDRRDAAYAFRDGLIIAVLITTGLRLKNLAALAIGTHVEPVGGRYRLSISAEDTKAGKPIDLLFSDRLTTYFDRYLADYRPCIHGPEQHDGLWPSTQGGPLGASAVYDVVCRRTDTEFGHAINPHLFRDIVATTISDNSPTEIGVARDLLGHTRLEMTDKYYRQGNPSGAVQQHARLLEALRAKNKTLA